MILKINPSDATPVYAQVMQQIKYVIAAGALKPGDRLPSVRELAAQLLINPNTILKVYGELEHEGVVISQKGRGIFVAETARTLNEKDRTALVLEPSRTLAAQAVHLGLSLSSVQEVVGQEYHKLKDQNRRHQK